MASSLSRAFSAVLIAGLVAGALDILAAFVVYGWLGVGPVRILQSISSGLLGAAASRGGATTAALGVVLQFVIATVAASADYIGSLRLPTLTERPIAWGAAYGVAVYMFMNFVVVPLSAVPKRPFNWGLAPVIVLIHIVRVGIPIGVVLNRSRSLARQ
jgi:hypothetical protein